MTTKKTIVLILFAVVIVFLLVGTIALIKIKEKNYALREMTIEESRNIAWSHLKAMESRTELVKVFHISGFIDMENHSGKLSPVFIYDGKIIGPEKRGDYFIELIADHNSDHNYSVLDYQEFSPIIIVDSNSKTGSFSFNLPYRSENVVGIRLRYGQKVLDEIKPGYNSPTIQINPVVTKQLPNTGEFKFSWSANDIDDDKLYYLVLISKDSQKTWKTISSGVPYPQLSYDVSRIQKSDGIFFQVLASDGINTSSDMVGPFSASVKMPMAQITNPKDGDSIQQGYPVILLGSGNSPEEESTIPDERLTWSSDISGILGNGQTLQVEKPLSKGKHVITLSVIDKYGNKGSVSVNLIIN